MRRWQTSSTDLIREGKSKTFVTISDNENSRVPARFGSHGQVTVRRIAHHLRPAAGALFEPFLHLNQLFGISLPDDPPTSARCANRLVEIHCLLSRDFYVVILELKFIAIQDFCS